MGDCFLGIDAGTGGARAIVFNNTGQILSTGSASYLTRHPKTGWSEQDPEDWFKGVLAACKGAVKGLPDPSSRIVAAGLTHQRHSFVPVDSSLAPLHPGILWNDLRCGEQVEWTRNNVDLPWLFRRTGYPPFGWSVYKIMWLRDHKPTVYDSTYKFFLVHDYLVHRLTGVQTTTQSSCTMTGCFDMETRSGWAEDVLDVLGIDANKFVSTIVPAGEYIGDLLPPVADQTGLPSGLPFYAAAGDQVCGTLGSGVSQPGTVAINGGTSLTLQTVVNEFPNCTQPNFSLEVFPTGDYAAEAVLFSGVSALMKWLTENFALPKRQVDPSWDDIYSMASTLPAGNEGLLLVPALQGLGGPEWTTEARAALSGLDVGHGYGHFVRAILEGCAYEVRLQIELMEEGTRAPISEIRSYGGSSRSDVYNQILADVSGLPVTVPSTPETTTLGAAMCAAVGHGAFESFDEAVGAMCSISCTFKPNEEHSTVYDRIYRQGYLPERKALLERTERSRGSKD